MIGSTVFKHVTAAAQKHVTAAARHFFIIYKFTKKTPRGPIFIDNSIVTEICYSISHWLTESALKKMSTNFTLYGGANGT